MSSNAAGVHLLRPVRRHRRLPCRAARRRRALGVRERDRPGRQPRLRPQLAPAAARVRRAAPRGGRAVRGERRHRPAHRARGDRPARRRPGCGLPLPAVLQERLPARHGRDPRDPVLEHRADPCRTRRSVPPWCCSRTCATSPARATATRRSRRSSRRCASSATARPASPRCSRRTCCRRELGGRPAGARARLHPGPLRRARGGPGPGELRRARSSRPSRSSIDWSKDRWDLPSDLPLESTTVACARRSTTSSRAELKWIQTGTAADRRRRAAGPGERCPGSRSGCSTLATSGPSTEREDLIERAGAEGRALCRPGSGRL